MYERLKYKLKELGENEITIEIYKLKAAKTEIGKCNGWDMLTKERIEK